jgi:uncharacterized protein
MKIIKAHVIKEAAGRLAKVYDPIAIYLFGSYAWGTPDSGSDLDFLVVVENSNEKSYKRSISGSKTLIDLMIPNDILVYTKDEFESRVKMETTLCCKVNKEGKLLYAKS